MSFENNFSLEEESHEKNWGASKAADAEYGGNPFDPTPEQSAAADRILEGSELENASIGDEEQEHTTPNWPPQN